MNTIEIIYSLVVAIFSLHFYFMWTFWRKTPKETKFSVLFWIKDNSLNYIFAWMGMILWIMLIDWNIVFDLYAKYVLVKYPILEILKAHAVVAFIAGFYNTRIFVFISKKVGNDLKLNAK
jgi:hypothetical protein